MLTFTCVRFYSRVLRKVDCKLYRNFMRNNIIPQKLFSSDVSAGIVIIGDEILKGLNDLNTPYLIKQLNALNVSINKVTIVPDNVDAIACEVKELSSKCSFVITSGGIGPTHDDVTYEAVAKACNDELSLNQEIFQHLITYFGPESSSNPGIIKYASIPKSAIVNYLNFNHNSKTLRYPIVSVNNIYIFPGVPVLLQKCFEHIKSKFLFSGNEKFTKIVFIDRDEFSITKILNETVDKFKGRVKFGSYPTFTDNYFKVKLVLESSNFDFIKEAFTYLNDHLPKESIVSIKENFLLSAKDDVYSLSKVTPCVSSSISVIEEAFQKYSFSELCICFNGGKDCTALLHLLYSCVQHANPEEWHNLHFLYVKNEDTFKEVEYFIQCTAERYDFNLTVLEGDLMEAISAYLKGHCNVKAMFLGTRKCDPGASNLQHFSVTDSNWPTIMRILPLLGWTYSDVWTFLRTLQVPYCVLYDRGYTSLGLKSKTVQNPSLLLPDKKGFQSYNPAYMLSDQDSERKSRL